MAEEPGYTFNVHLKDDTKFEVRRIPSSDTDWVSLGIGRQSSLFVMNVDQAKALVDAAEETYFMLRAIADEKARTERARNCSDVNPCPGCQEYLNKQDNYYNYPEDSYNEPPF